MVHHHGGAVFEIPVGDDIGRFADLAVEPERVDEEDDVSLAEKMGVTTDRLMRAVELIPAAEADLLNMYFGLDKTQDEIAAVLNCSQANVSYRLQRALRRLRFYLEVPEMTEAELRAELDVGLRPERKGALTRAGRADLLVTMWRTTSQLETANLLGLSQGRVRHVVFHETERMREIAKSDPRCARAAAWFGALIDQKMWNVARAVVLPQWTKKREETIKRSPYGEQVIGVEPGSGVRQRVI